MEVFEINVEMVHEATKEIVGGLLDSVEINTSPGNQKTGRKHKTSAGWNYSSSCFPPRFVILKGVGFLSTQLQ